MTRRWRVGWAAEVVLVALVALVATLRGPSVPPVVRDLEHSVAWSWLDAALTWAGAVAFWLRRLHREASFWLGVAAMTTATATGHWLNIAQVSGAAVAVSLALHRDRRPVLIHVGAATLLLLTATLVRLGNEGWIFIRPSESLFWLWIGAAIGMVVRGQRALVTALEQRVERAEAAQEQLALRRVAEERVRIARELHDVMAHHVSVIGVQAGAAQHVLATRPDVAKASLATIRTAAATVLDELQGVLAVLRQDEETTPLEPATPDDLADLIASGRALGTPVSLTGDTTLADLSPAARSAAYRLTQEGLTNAGKHAPGQPLTLTLTRGAEWRITLSNPLPPTDAAAATPVGFGLVGMRERVTAAGGVLAVGPGPGGVFVVDATLPRRPGADLTEEQS